MSKTHINGLSKWGHYHTLCGQFPPAMGERKAKDVPTCKVCQRAMHSKRGQGHLRRAAEADERRNQMILDSLREYIEILRQEISIEEIMEI